MIAQRLSKHSRPMLVAAATFTGVHLYYNEKTYTVGRDVKLPKPAIEPPQLPPKITKFSYRRLVRVIKRLIEVAARLFPVLVSYLLKSTPIGETREQWLKRLVQTLANLGNPLQHVEN